MNLAIKNNERITASPKEKAVCPLCNQEVIAKCGEIKIWHWAHKQDFECDSFGEPESEWHLKWKNYFSREYQEVVMGKHRADIRTKNRWIIELQNSSISSKEIEEREEYYKRMVWLLNGKTLCAGLDLRIKKGVITFRWKNPPKSWWYANKEIYIDLSEIIDGLKINIKDYSIGNKTKQVPIYEQEEYEYYTPEAELVEVSYPKVIDYIDVTEKEIKNLKEKIELFKDKLFLIKKIYKKIPCGGWGILINKKDFINKYKDEDEA
jgi:competence CoiA-like predicted nuclease